MPCGIGGARIDHRHGERRAVGLLEGQGQGEARQAAARDQEAAAAGAGRHRPSSWRILWCGSRVRDGGSGCPKRRAQGAGTRIRHPACNICVASPVSERWPPVATMLYVARGQRTETLRLMTDANTDAMTDAVAELHRHPRPRAPGGRPVPRPEPEDRMAAGLRRAGRGAGAGRRDPDGAGRPPGPLAARLFHAPGRSPHAHRLRGRAHPRWAELHHAPGQGDPARAGDLRHDGLLSGVRGRPDAPARDAGRGGAGGPPRRQGPGGGRAHRHAGGDRRLFRSRAPDRAAIRST